MENHKCIWLVIIWWDARSPSPNIREFQLAVRAPIRYVQHITCYWSEPLFSLQVEIDCIDTDAIAKFNVQRYCTSQLADEIWPIFLIVYCLFSSSAIVMVMFYGSVAMASIHLLNISLICRALDCTSTHVICNWTLNAENDSAIWGD